MTPEDRLRQLLQSDSTPVGDGLTVIRSRVARRRRLRLVLVPLVGLAVSGAAAAVFVVGGGNDSQRLVQVPITHAPSPTPTVGDPTIGPTPTGTDAAYTGPALMAFTSADKDTVVRHWLAEVGIDGFAERHTCESCDVVGIAVAGTHVGDAYLARSDHGLDRQFVLVNVSNDGLVVSTPRAGTTISSPTTVTGTLSEGVDENVLLRLLTQSGTVIGQTSAPAGSAVPWSGSLAWTDSTWSKGQVVATTSSAKDGAITRITAFPVSA